MILRETRTEHLSEPIGVGGILVEIFKVVAQFLIGRSPLGGVEHIGFVGHHVHRHIAVVVDGSVRTRPFLGSDENDPPCRA